MRYKATTESGSVYEIDPINRTWSKNDGPAEDLEELRSGFKGSTVPVMDWPEVTQPRVAENMFIQSGEDLSKWILTTPVIHVEEIEDLEETIRGGIE